MSLPGAGLAFHRTEVTRADFAAFVETTAYVTLAERSDPEQPGERLGAAVFQTPEPGHPSWWRLDRTADWRSPRGSGDVEGTDTVRADHPVVQIAYPDALAYAGWLGGRLPTLEEWRAAALGGEAWTALTAPPDAANTWQGLFPLTNRRSDGHAGLAPVASYPANAAGLHDMVGNAWEWTQTQARPGHRLLAGGSFLCDVDICRNGTPFGQQVQEEDFSADHIGFRLVFDAWPETCGPLPESR